MSDAHANLENVERLENGQVGEGFNEAAPPSQPGQESELSKEHQQVRKWLQDAIIANRGDVYSGKRDEARFKKPIQLDVKFFDSGPSETTRATMHNISCTGIAFWVREEVELGTVVQVRDCDPLARISWVSASITHCRHGLRGFIVGARFESPLTDPPPGWQDLLGMTDSEEEPEVAHDPPAVCEGELAEACDSTTPCEPTDSCEPTDPGESKDPCESKEDAATPADCKPGCEPCDEHDAGAERPDDDGKRKSDRGILSWFGLG